MAAVAASTSDKRLVALQAPPGSRSPTDTSRSTDATDVVLPEIRTSANAVDKNKPLPTSLQSDFLPNEILLALTQPPPNQDKLGAPSRHRNINVTTTYGRKPGASVWNYPQRREKFKHLTSNTPCVCGAGKDISFLYDVPKPERAPEKPGVYDTSKVRLHEDEEEEAKPKMPALPDTLIPEEYHIVKNKGVMGLEFTEGQFSTQPEDHEKHLVLFPSMLPNSRYEVLQLKKTLQDMVDKAGLNEADILLTGPTQMHNLLELIKKEQSIYNVIFHEVIRQVSVECLERGELLAGLREKYSHLLNKVPKQIKGLHEEVLAQRALDRRLTEELMRFRSTIGILTNELSTVKEHDNEVTLQAHKAQDDLKTALFESHKNTALLAEYHDLYELQRKRLEKKVSVVSEEREIWSIAAYSLALKVMEEHSLNTAKRLHVCEKSWSKLANHFTVRLSDKDMDMLTQLQAFVDQWHAMVEDFQDKLRQREADMAAQLQTVRSRVQYWIKDFQRNLMSKEGHMQKLPDKNRMDTLYTDVNSWQQTVHDAWTIAQEAEKFGGDTVLTGQEALQQIRLQVFGWTDCALKIFGRHRQEGSATHPDQDQMHRVNHAIDELLAQYATRMTGENGVATGMIHLENSLEFWDTKLNAAVYGSAPLPDQEWLRLFQMFDDWIISIDTTLTYVGTTQKEQERNEGKISNSIELPVIIRLTHKWLTSTTNSIDNEDAKLVEAVSALHTEMVKWMVQILLHLAPDREDHSKEAKESLLLGGTTVGVLQTNAKSLFSRLSHFTKYVAQCCQGFVMDEMQRKQKERLDEPDADYKELQKCQAECEDWINTAKLLLTELTGEPYKESPSPSSADMSTNMAPSGEAKVVYHDEEKLENQSDEGETEPGPEEAGDSTPPQPSGEDTTETSDRGQAEAPPTSAESPPTSPPTSEAPPTVSTPLAEAPPVAPPETMKEEEPKERLEVIGYDANTRTRLLEQSPDAAPPHVASPVQRRECPKTPNTKKAFEALAAVNSLQAQLLATEERAQQAEERAADAEMELRSAQEVIRSLEHRLKEPGAPPASESEAKLDSPTTSPESATTSQTPKESTPKATSNKPLLTVKDGSKGKDKGKDKPNPPSRSSSRSSTKSKKGK